MIYLIVLKNTTTQMIADESLEMRKINLILMKVQYLMRQIAAPN